MHPGLLRALAFASLCSALAGGHALRAADGDALLSLLTKLQPTEGWTAPEPARVAVGENLFELIDGGAELYHEFGFRQAATWSLETPARAGIQIELYEMTSAAAAYGACSLMQSGTFTRGDLGQGSLRFGYYIAFWSGPYFVSVTGTQPDSATQAEVDRLAARIAVLLPHNGELPAWFERLPAKELQERKYFRGRIGLSNINIGEVVELFDSHEGLVAAYPGCKLLRLHLATAADATAQLASAAKAAAARSSLHDVKADVSGFTCTDAAGNRIAVRTRGEDILAFVFTDEARYRALAAQLE